MPTDMTKYNRNKDPEREIALLSDLSHADLAVRWQIGHGAPPPKGMSRRLLLLALAYQLQADAYGALDSKTSRYLRAVAAGSLEAVRPLPALKAGMRLMREWNGRTHVVDVIEPGRAGRDRASSGCGGKAHETQWKYIFKF